MKIAKMLLKIAGVILLLGVIVLYIVINHSMIESSYECRGTITRDGVALNKTIYMKLQEARFWVKLWSNKDANIWIEFPTETVEFYSDVKKNGDIFAINDKNKIIGSYLQLSNRLSIQFRSGFFDGDCKRLN